MDEQRKCAGKRKNGQPCQSWALPGQPYCWTHSEHPDTIEKRKEARAKGGHFSGAARKKLNKAQVDRDKLLSVEGVTAYIAQVITDTRRGEINPATSRALVYALSAQLKALEVSDLEQRVTALEQKQEVR